MMINIYDIKTGNVLLSTATGGMIMADWLVIKHIADGNIMAFPQDARPVYEPVIIDEALLPKIGFEKEVFDELSWYKLPMPERNQSWEIFTGDKNGYLEVIIEFNGEEVVRLNQLHILQNWYRMITGEELTIKM